MASHRTSGRWRHFVAGHYLHDLSHPPPLGFWRECPYAYAYAFAGRWVASGLHIKSVRVILPWRCFFSASALCCHSLDISSLRVTIKKLSHNFPPKWSSYLWSRPCHTSQMAPRIQNTTFLHTNTRKNANPFIDSSMPRFFSVVQLCNASSSCSFGMTPTA